MPHAVAPNLREGNLDTTLFANDPPILHTLVLAAQALVILDRTEDTSAEQAIPFWLKRPIIDCLRLFDFAKRPGVNPLRASYRDSDLIEALRPADLPKDIHQFVHQRPLSESVSTPSAVPLAPREKA